MSANDFDCLQAVVINPNVISTTLNVLRHFGEFGCEALVLWAGLLDGSQAHIVKAMVPTQHPIKNEKGVGYFVDSDTLFLLNKELAESGLRLIAQVHSHPTAAYHSEADDRYAIVTTNGGLSLVVPNFGQAPADPCLWAVYRLSGGSWRELSVNERRGLLRVGVLA